MLPLLAACAGPAADSGSGATSPAEAAPPTATWSTDAALSAITSGLASGLPDAVSGLRTYLTMMESGDSQCPGPGKQLIDTQVPLTGCTASSGFRYSGVSMFLEGDALSGGNPEVEGMLLGGDFRITDAEGNAYDFGGQVDWFSLPGGQRGPDTGGASARVIHTDVSGTFGYPGGDPWLGNGVSAVLQMQAETASSGESAFVVDGGLGTLDVDLWMHELRFGANACAEGAAAGRVDVRDPSGAWWSLDYGDACSGCGSLAYATLDPADACLDLSGTGTTAMTMMQAVP